jgi:AAA+ superfamily predicted ATPase
MQQMHHEDKAGLNTVPQRLDNLRLTRLPLAAVIITNRPDALDPAIRRRAELGLRFRRPDDQTRAEIIRTSVPELEISNQQMAKLLRLTGEQEEKTVGMPFTATDITDRLLPGALRVAFQEQRVLQVEDLLEQAQVLLATPLTGTS